MKDLSEIVADTFESFNSEESVSQHSYFTHSIIPNASKAILSQIKYYFESIISNTAERNITACSYNKEELLEQSLALAQTFTSNSIDSKISKFGSLAYIKDKNFNKELYNTALWAMMKSIYLQGLSVFAKPTSDLNRWVIKWNSSVQSTNKMYCEMLFLIEDDETTIVFSVKDKE